MYGGGIIPQEDIIAIKQPSPRNLTMLMIIGLGSFPLRIVVRLII